MKTAAMADGVARRPVVACIRMLSPRGVGRRKVAELAPRSSRAATSAVGALAATVCARGARRLRSGRK